MPDLQAGTAITGTDAPTLVSATENTSQAPTSTSYAAGAQAIGVAFYAPTTGRVLLLWNAFLDNNTGGAHTLIAPEVREGSSIGSGDPVLLASDELALQHEGTNQLRGGMFYPLDGLTPGAQYNVRLLHRVTGGTGTVDDRGLTVKPLS